MLFADLSGFTRLVESAEPETVYDVVRPLLDELVSVVRLHGGSVQQVLGDGFMAVFGLHPAAPRCADAAERAVRAALAMLHPRLGRLPVHVGVEYGEVLVTAGWSPARYGVWGRPVNLARRLCDLAGPGELQVGPAAAARARHCLTAATPVRTRLDGITRRVVAHRMSGAAALAENVR